MNVDELIKNASVDSKMVFTNHRVCGKVNKAINGIYSYLLVQNKMVYQYMIQTYTSLATFIIRFNYEWLC